MQIGLLEDDIATQEMLLLVLQDEGYVVTNYPDAEECLDTLTREKQSEEPLPIELLIIDWRLNGSMSGVEVIRQLRTHPHLESLPVILTTAATFNDAEELQKLQVALLEKPFSVEEITRLIKELIHSNTSV